MQQLEQMQTQPQALEMDVWLGWPALKEAGICGVGPAGQAPGAFFWVGRLGAAFSAGLRRTSGARAGIATVWDPLLQRGAEDTVEPLLGMKIYVKTANV